MVIHFSTLKIMISDFRFPTKMLYFSHWAFYKKKHETLKCERQIKKLGPLDLRNGLGPEEWPGT